MLDNMLATSEDSVKKIKHAPIASYKIFDKVYNRYVSGYKKSSWQKPTWVAIKLKEITKNRRNIDDFSGFLFTHFR